MLENEENKMNTENNESEVKNESNIENVETVKNDAEDSATNKATEEMFEESDFVTPPQDVEETADAAQADTVQTSETDQAQISKEPRALPSTVIPISRIIRNRLTLAVTGTAIIRRHRSREENTDTA